MPNITEIFGFTSLNKYFQKGVILIKIIQSTSNFLPFEGDNLSMKTIFPNRPVLQVCEFKCCPHWILDGFRNISEYPNLGPLKIWSWSPFLVQEFYVKTQYWKVVFGIFHHWHNLLNQNNQLSRQFIGPFANKSRKCHGGDIFIKIYPILLLLFMISPATFKSASSNGIHIKANILGHKTQLLQMYMNNKE